MSDPATVNSRYLLVSEKAVFILFLTSFFVFLLPRLFSLPLLPISYSLSRSDQAIASLYTALFPIFPSSSTDSRYHLQALRHFYVLAAEPRVLVTRDVETGRASSVRVCVRGGGGVEEMRGRTPCILPEWSTIQEVSKQETGGRENDNYRTSFIFLFRYF